MLTQTDNPQARGKAATRYRANLLKDGEAPRALFVIDGSGVICWCYVSPIEVSSGADGVLKALDELQKFRFSW